MDGKTVKSWNEALELVRNDCTINFVAMAVTQWNALSIDALLFYLEDIGYEINALIVIAEHYSAGYLIQESYFTNKRAVYYRLPYTKGVHDIEPRQEKAHTGFVGKMKDVCDYYRIVFDIGRKGKDCLFYSTYNHTIPDAVILQKLGDMGRPVIVCRSEEGIGPYMGTFDKTYPPLREVKTIPELHGYFRTVFWGREIYRRLHVTYNSLTLKSTWQGLKVNETIIPYYRKVFALRNEMVKPPVDKALIEKSIIICTASWKRHLIDDEEDLRVMKRVCDDLYGRGFHLLLKPHPRDQYYPPKAEELHCEILDVPGLTMESLCEYAQPKAVVSFASTTLVNPYVFWRIPTYCVTEMLNREKMMSYLDEIDSFKRVFKNFVRFVKDTSEIEVS